MMQALGYPFCPVCREGTICAKYKALNCIQAYSPTGTSFNLSGSQSSTLRTSPLRPDNHHHKIEWIRDGVLTGTMDTELPQWIELVQEIYSFLRKKTLTGAIDAAWLKSTIEHLYARVHLAQNRVFTSIITVTYLLIGDDA